jgi:hypothetical protein
MFRRSSAAVATSREGHRLPRSGRAGQHRRWGRGRVTPGLLEPAHRISRADVADFLIEQIDDDAFLHKTPVLMS